MKMNLVVVLFVVLSATLVVSVDPVQEQNQHLLQQTQSEVPPYLGPYYANVNTSKTLRQFERELFNVISNQTSITYSRVWDAFMLTDTVFPSCPYPNNNVHDIYSNKCWNRTGQCGNYKKEGDCYNREHSWPKSWWGGADKDKVATTDMHHVYPSDGYVNGRRGNLPLGDVIKGTETYVSNDGCKIGNCESKELGVFTCFEPSPETKGMLARTYFYMSTRYLDEWECCNNDGQNGSHLKWWMERTLKVWHYQNPVTLAEAKRNEIIYEKIQGNRNPYVDHPEWVYRIWKY